MAMTRQERVSLHSTQPRNKIETSDSEVSIGSSVVINEFKENVPVIRNLGTEGVVEYIKINGVLYKRALTRVSDLELQGINGGTYKN